MNRLTKHAQKRAQQRGVSSQLISYLNKYGVKQHDNHGCVKIFFNKNSKNKMLELGIKVSDKIAKLYMVQDCKSGTTVTIGYLTKKIKRR